MKTILFKSFFVVIVLMGSVPAAAFAETLSEAIDEALVVHRATLEALSVYKAAINEVSARSEEAQTQQEMDVWGQVIRRSCSGCL